MKKFMVIANFKITPDDNEKQRIKNILLDFSHEISGIPKNHFRSSSKEGSWELILVAVGATGIFVTKETSSFFIKYYLEKLTHKKSSGQDIEDSDHRKDTAVNSLKIKETSINIDIMYKMDDLCNDLSINVFRIVKINDDETVHMCERSKEGDDKIVNLIEFNSPSDFEKYISQNK